MKEIVKKMFVEKRDIYMFSETYAVIDLVKGKRTVRDIPAESVAPGF